MVLYGAQKAEADPFRAVEEAARHARAAGHESHKIEPAVVKAFAAQDAVNLTMIDVLRTLQARVEKIEANSLRIDP